MSSSAAAGMSMPGMMSDAQMQQLTDASGAEFDRLFLEMMIMHHQGAIEMANTEIAEGSNPEALALAESITTSQTAEITEMQQLLQSPVTPPRDTGWRVDGHQPVHPSALAVLNSRRRNRRDSRDSSRQALALRRF